MICSEPDGGCVCENWEYTCFNECAEVVLVDSSNRVAQAVYPSQDCLATVSHGVDV